jgi:hypothetical protein
MWVPGIDHSISVPLAVISRSSVRGNFEPSVTPFSGSQKLIEPSGLVGEEELALVSLRAFELLGRDRGGVVRGAGGQLQLPPGEVEVAAGCDSWIQAMGCGGRLTAQRESGRAGE